MSKLSQGTVDAYLQASSEEEMSSEEVKNHPLMEWEVNFQNELLDKIEQGKRHPDFIRELKALAVEEGISNIGLEIS